MTPAPQAPEGQNPCNPAPALTTALSSQPSHYYSAANRRAATCLPCRAYPWLLVLSTAIAGLFCLMYITKPVIPSPLAPPTVPAMPATPAAKSPVARTAPNTATGLLPDASHLPGEHVPPPANGAPNSPRGILTGGQSSPVFEETNLRIQHILTAQAPGGHLARIDLDVPVLYQSRSLRWTPADIAEARKLLAQLMDYQEKSQRLRAEGADLLDSWNHLIARSLPATDLRADSPSLPANQEEAATTPRPTGLNTTEAIQILPAGK